ncbi:MAG: hypothetical protein U0X20_17155 [Caldilineaceae bacterium]
MRTISTLLITLILWLAATNTATAQTNDPPPYVEPGYQIISTAGNTSHGLSYVYHDGERVGTFCLYVYECDTFTYTQPVPPTGRTNPYAPEDWIADGYNIQMFDDGSGRITNPAEDNIIVTIICMAWATCDRPDIWPDTPRAYLPIAFNP